MKQVYDPFYHFIYFGLNTFSLTAINSFILVMGLYIHNSAEQLSLKTP